MPRTARFLFACLLAMAACGLTSGEPISAADPLKVLIVDGQNNHNWQVTTPFLKSMLEQTGRFQVAVVTSPPKNAPADRWNAFRPRFQDYDVVLSNYNGELWPEAVRKSLERFVEGGGGLVVVHAANNAFPEWDAWNRMIGLGWRGAEFGPRLTVNDVGESVITPPGQGPGSGHGPQHAYPIVIRERQHPVMRGLPAEWMHSKDELYHGQRGPAANMHVLATAWSASEQGGTAAHEPMVWWIPFGQGRVFTTVLGHVGGRSDDLTAMRCVGFQTIVGRGCEWAATRRVTLPLSEHFPTASAVSTTPAAETSP